jgi:hypothetical protein
LVTSDGKAISALFLTLSTCSRTSFPSCDGSASSCPHTTTSTTAATTSTNNSFKIKTIKYKYK